LGAFHGRGAEFVPEPLPGIVALSVSKKLPSSGNIDRRETTGLVLLFGAMYFVQGIAEPTEGLIAQPVRSLLKSWGYTAAAIAGFGAILSLPWSLKPIYGLLTDFVPILGTRRRSYLLLTSGASSLALFYLYLFPVANGAHQLLFLLLLIPTVGVAFSDVVIDALMVEKGQPRGMTGSLQSVQWAAMYGGTIGAALLGGYLSQNGMQQSSFLICAVTSFSTFLLTWYFVNEQPQQRRKGQFQFAIKELISAARRPAVLASAAFLFLWSFNPFSSSVLYLHMTQHLGQSEQFYGVTVSSLSIGAIIGSLAYGSYCRRISLAWMIHLSIAAGVLSTLAYGLVTDQTSALIVNAFVGFTYLTGSMVQFDLAARACPVSVAGTLFATLMALSNLSMSLSTALGGWLYDHWVERWGGSMAFNFLLVAGALSTCLCWTLVPFLKATIPSNSDVQAD
jgi:predicted MFS family arabinose efflux permease